MLTGSQEVADRMKENQEGADNPSLFSEVQMLLAEKRTALAGLRTGIAVFALPLSVFSLLVATSKYYQASRVLHFLLPLVVLCVVLLVLGTYLVLHSLRRARHVDRLIRQLKHRYSSIAELLD